MYCFLSELAALLDVPTFRLVASSLHFLFLFTWWAREEGGGSESCIRIFYLFIFLNYRRSSFWSEGFTSNSGGSPGVPGWGRRSLWRICRAWRDRGAYGPQREDCSCPWLSPQQRPSIGPPKFSSLAPGQARTDGLFSHWWWWKSSTSVGRVTEENRKNEKKGGRGKKAGLWMCTFLDSGLGVPSTLLFIFGAGFILSMPNSELGAIPGRTGQWQKGIKIKRLPVYKTVL